MDLSKHHVSLADKVEIKSLDLAIISITDDNYFPKLQNPI